MPIQKDWKTYYTMEEVDARLKASIRKNARELVEELNEMRKSSDKLVPHV